MKIRLYRILGCGLVIIALQAWSAKAQQSYSVSVSAGQTILLANQLDQGSNSFSEVFTNATDGDEILKYVCGGGYQTWIADSGSPSGYDDSNGVSTSQGTLSPGEGAFYISANSKTLTFRGTPHVPVLPVPLPCGFGKLNLLSRQTNDLGTYETITGYAAQNGAQVLIWNGASFDTNTYTTKGWSLNTPTLGVGQAALFNVPTGSTPIGSLVYQGLTNIGTGNGIIQTSGSNLVVTNLGSSGQDGVTILWQPNMTALDLHITQFDASNTLPVGAYLQEQETGSGNGINEVLGSARVTKAGTRNYAYTVDFSPLGVSNCLVQAYLQGVLVGQVTNIGGGGTGGAGIIIVTTQVGPFSTDYESTNGSFTWDFGFGISALLAGTEAVTCDQIFISPIGASNTTPTAYILTGSQVPAITISSQNATVTYQGLDNTSLGAATLLVSSADLVISNLGSSGQDGVTATTKKLATTASSGGGTGNIADGAATDLTIHWQDPDISNTLPTGAYLQSQAVGTANGITNGVLGTLTVRKAGGGNYALSADYSPAGASNYTVQAYFHGVLVGQGTGQSGASFASVNMFPRGKDLGDIITPLSDEWPGSQTATLTMSGQSLPCDHLVVSPLNVSYTIDPSVFQIVASQIPSLTITSENVGLVYQGLTNTSLGNALIVKRLDRSTPSLYLGNLGSSGQDGVSVAIDPNIADGAAKGQATDLTIQFEPPDPSNSLPVGAYLQEQLVGTANGITNGLLGDVTMTKECAVCNGTNWIMTADFSPMASSTYTVQALLQGVPVGQATDQNGASLAACGILPIKIDWQKNDEGSPTLSIHWLLATALTGFGTSSVTCDELLITPNNVSSFSSSTALQLTASQIPSLTIDTENAGLVYQGLTNTSTGYSSIASDGTNLVISNLTSGGQDGVTIFFPGTKPSVEVEWEDWDLTNGLPVGAYLEQQIIGTAGPVTKGVLETVTTTKVGTSNYVVAADFSAVGASTYTAQAFLDGVEVAQTTTMNGAPLLATAKPGGSGGLKLSCCPFSISLTIDIGKGANATSTQSSFGTGSVFTWDTMVLTPNNVAFSSPPIALQITGSLIPGLTITSENPSLVYQGLTNIGLGNATIALSGSNLVVANLGSSGQDGVSFTMPGNTSGMDMHYLPLDPSNTMPIGAYLQSQVVGNANGVINGILGTTTVTKEGASNYVIAPNFSALGATSFTVQAYLHGALVAQADATAGTTFTIPICPVSVDYENGSWTWDWIFGPLPAMTLSGQLVSFDQLYFTPDNVALNGAASAFQITASQIPTITITGNNASLVYQGLTNTSLGNAALVYWGFATSSNKIHIPNLGSSGQDGVSVALPPGLVALDLGWDDLDPTNGLPIGAYLQQQVMGPLPGTNSIGALETVTTTKAGVSNYVVTADFSPTGASNYTAEAYLGGVLVAQTTANNGAALTTVAKPGGTGGLKLSCCPFSCSVTIDIGKGGGASTESTRSSFGTGAAVAWDTLVLTPNSGIVGGAPTAYQLTSSQIPSINLNGEWPSLVFQGLTNNPNGNAYLVWGPTTNAPNQLVITNLGSGGQDGLSVALPGFDSGVEVEWQDLDPTNGLPIGAYLRQELIGTAGLVTNGVLGSVTTTKAGASDYVISADFSPIFASTYTAQAFLKGILVAQSIGMNGSAMTTTARPGGSGGVTTSCCPWTISITIDIGKGGSGASPIEISSFAGGPPVAWDTLVVTPNDVALSSPPTALELASSQIPGMTITSENASLVYMGVTNTSLGTASIGYGGGTSIIISNLTSGGQDGVTFIIPDSASSWGAEWADVDADGLLPVGAYEVMQIIGTLGPVTNGVLGTVITTKEGVSNLVTTADFSPIGVTNMSLQVYNNMTPVGSPMNTGNGTIISGPKITGSLKITFKPFTITLDIGSASAAMQIANGPMLTGNSVALVPGYGDGPWSHRGVSVTLQGSQIPEFDITQETPAPTEYDGQTQTALGNASLQVSGSTLYVSNLTSGGQDGVAFTLPAGATSWGAQWQNLDPAGTAAIGAYLTATITGPIRGLTNRPPPPWGVVTVAKTAANTYSISANFSASGASNFTALAYDGSILTGSATGLASTVGTSTNLPFDLEIDSTGPTISWHNAPTTLTLNGIQVVADKLQLIPQGVSFDPPMEVDLQASGIPAIDITQQSSSPIIFDGITNSSLGNATFVAQSSELDAINLGSSGQDGVGVTLPGGLNTFEAQWQDLDPSNAVPSGAYLEQEINGTGGSVTNDVLGFVKITKQGGAGCAVTANFSNLGVKTETVRVYSGSNLVAQAGGQSGQLASFIHLPLDGGISSSNSTISITITFHKGGAQTAISLAGQAPVQGDRIEIEPETSMPIIASSEQFLMSNIPGMNITNETASILYGGLQATGLGNASIAYDHTNFYITNLSSGGQDGVSFALPNTASWGTEWADVDADGRLAVGAYEQMEILGTAGPITNGVLGTVTTTKDGESNYVTSVDFSPLGVTSMSLQVYDGTTPVGSPQNTGNGAVVSSPKISASITIKFKPFSITIDIGPAADSMAVFNGPTLTGNNFTLTPSNVPTSGVSATTVQLQTSQIPSLTFMQQTVTPVVLAPVLTKAGLTIQWLGTGVLQQSGDLKTWNDLPAATSPFTVPTSGTGSFYRVRQPLEP